MTGIRSTPPTSDVAPPSHVYRPIERPLTSRSKLRGSNSVIESRVPTSAGIVIRPVTPRTWNRLPQEDPSQPQSQSPITFYGNEAYGQLPIGTATTACTSNADKDSRQSHPQYQPLSSRSLHTSSSSSSLVDGSNHSSSSSTRSLTNGTPRPVSRLGMDRSGATSRFTVPKLDATTNHKQSAEGKAESISKNDASNLAKRLPVRAPAFKISRELLAARMNTSGSNETTKIDANTTSSISSHPHSDPRTDISPEKIGLPEHDGCSKDPLTSPPSPLEEPTKSITSLVQRSSSASSSSSSSASRKLSVEATAAFVSTSKSFVMPHHPNGSSSGGSNGCRNGSARGKRTDSSSVLSTNEAQSPSSSAPLATYSAARRFLLSPGPIKEPLQCRVERMKAGILGSASQYAMLLEEDGSVLFTARRHRRANGSAVFQIFLNASPGAPADTHICVAKISTSFLGTEYVMSGIVEETNSPSQNDDGFHGGKGENAGSIISCELGAVAYAQNLMGTKGPRKIAVVLPKLVPSGDSTWELQPALGQDSLLTKHRHGDTNSCIILSNRAPRWNSAIGAYCLNFGGRVTQASVKNMQLVSHDNPDRVIVQFGRVGAEEFTLDYAFPVTPLQAFLVALSALDPKLGCE